ncbi:hypothetical protein COOONC_22068, partial [Cooperia oncophora]
MSFDNSACASVAPFQVKSYRARWNSQNSEEVPHEETFVNKLFREIIGPFLLERSTQVCAVLLYIIYLTLAIIGCLHIKEGLDPRFLVRESFYLSNFYKLIYETFWYE